MHDGYLLGTKVIDHHVSRDKGLVPVGNKQNVSSVVARLHAPSQDNHNRALGVEAND